MSVSFAVTSSRNPWKKDERRYFPRVVTGKPLLIRDIATEIKERSSLSLGDIQSVLTNFTEVMSENIKKGHAVLIEHFASFRPQIKAVTQSRAEDVSAKDIKDMTIRITPCRAIKPVLKSNSQGIGGISFTNVSDKSLGGKYVAPEGIKPEEDKGGGEPQPQAPAQPGKPGEGVEF